jgi:transcriptional regulator with XRE-family HTH domain
MSATAEKGHDVPTLLREAWPRHTAKQAARAAGVPHETARNWLRGRATPSAETLLRAAAECERLATALERLLHDRRRARLLRLASPAAVGAAAADGAGR